MKDYRDITYRYLKVQKKRTLLTLIGIILSVALITSIGTMIISMRDLMIKNEIERNGDYHAIFRDTPGDKVKTIENYVGIANSALIHEVGIGALAKITEDEKQANQGTPPYRYVNIMGYDESAFEMLPIVLKEGRLPKNEGELLIEYWLLDYMPGNPKIGDVLTLPMGIRLDESGNKLPKNTWSDGETFEEKDMRKYTIVGLIQPESVWVGAKATQAITYMDNNKLSPSQSYGVYVKMNSTKEVYKRSQAIGQKLGLTTIKYNEGLLRLSAQSLDMGLNNSLVAILLFIIVLIMVSTVAVIYNAFHISVLERISQFGILRCVGSSPSQIRSIVFKEAWILSIIGIPIGLASGIFAMKVVMYFIGDLAFEIFEGLSIVVSPAVFLVSTILGLITIFLSALGPASQAGKIPPLEAVRNTGSFKKESFHKIKKSALSRRLLGIEGEIAYKNLRRNRKRFKITLFSMIISIVLYIVFSSFMTFMMGTGSINSGEGADFMIWNNDRSQNTELNDTIYEDLKILPGVDKVFYQHENSVQILAPKNRVYSEYLLKLASNNQEIKKEGLSHIYNNSLIAYKEENLDAFKPLLKKGEVDPIALNKENGVLIVQKSMIYNQNVGKGRMIDIVDFQIGDRIDITSNYNTEDPKYSKVKILGILKEGILDTQYNLNEGTLIITTKQVYDRIEGTNDNPFFNIIAKDGEDLEPIRQYLKQLVENKPSYTYQDRVQQAIEEKQINMTLSIFLYGFVAVITLIGFLNIINTISTNLILRTKELSMLKAVGMTENGIKKIVAIEALFYGIIASIYGGVIGTGLSYILYRLITDGISSFDWAVPWKHILISVGGATIIALISGYLPLRKINHGNIIENIRMEE